VEALSDPAIASRFVYLPHADELPGLALAAEKLNHKGAGLPNVALMVDGSHIKIAYSDTRTLHADFRNRKGYFSVILQGVCDAHSRFRSVHVGWCGSVHDARVFRNTRFGAQVQDGTILHGDVVTLLDGTKVAYCVAGDSAYSAYPTLLKPHADCGKLNDEQLWFNYVQSVTRQPIERAFGRLKGRWRVLLETCRFDVASVPIVTLACVVLHNICEDHAETFDPALLPHDESDSEEEDADGVAATAAAAAAAKAAHLPTAADQRAALGKYLWARAPQEVKDMGVANWRLAHGRHVQGKRVSKKK
jgi:hypothetical protein